MKRMLISSLGLMALLGCSSATDVSNQVSSVELATISATSSVQWNNVSVPSAFTFEFNDLSQQLNNAEIDSRVAGFSFKPEAQTINIAITAPMKNKNVFAPSLALYDQDFKLLKVYSSSAFKYDRNDFIKGEVLFGEVSVTLPLSTTRVNAVIFTTDEDIAKTTTVIHPAKAMAIAKRNEPPLIADPVVSHSDSGFVNVKLSVPSSFSLLPSSNKAPATPAEAIDPQLNGTVAAASATAVAASTSKSEVTAQPETQNYYISSIEAAVKADDIPKALALLEEAKALNVEGAQDAFVKAINAK
ncbi:MalM family protein [Vibrio maritimus]|uniref:MalM family protein n=1 Tax=Vibrio maritimus TaxID=990268 RepID=UPI001F45141D|nr:MalM family protein [Vibrio maritimus]